MQAPGSVGMGQGVLMMEFSKEVKAQFDKMEICILSPISIPEPKWIQDLANMISFSWMQGLKIYQMGITERMVVDWARNDLARKAHKHINEYTGRPFTHFLWLDADHVFHPSLACRLAQHMALPEVDAVSALYYQRSGNPLPVAYVKDFNEDHYKHFPLIEVPPALCEVDAVGFGALLMKRDVFDRVPEPWFTIDYRAGEDIAFCVEAKKHGVRFFLDGGVKIGHVGTAPIISEKDHRKHLEENTHLYSDKVKVALGGKHP
jgi:hypothetical protein